MTQYTKHLFLVRHGETEFNQKKAFQGQVNSPLTELGLRQARDTAEKAKKLSIDILISSDLGRAVQTAEIISQEIGIPISKTDPLIRERCFGDIEGKCRDEVKCLYPQFINKEGKLDADKDFQGSENLIDFYDRIVKSIADVQSEYTGKKIMIVAHQGVLNMVYAHYNNISPYEVRGVYYPENCIIENY